MPLVEHSAVFLPTRNINYKRNRRSMRLPERYELASLPLLLIASASLLFFLFYLFPRRKPEQVLHNVSCARALMILLGFANDTGRLRKVIKSLLGCSSRLWSSGIYKSNENQITRAYKSRDSKWLITFIILRVLNHIPTLKAPERYQFHSLTSRIVKL